MRDTMISRQPGRPCHPFPSTSAESMPDNRTKGGRQTGGRESDRFIRLMTAGNAARGKEATDGRAQ
jgi:hypothetical protein